MISEERSLVQRFTYTCGSMWYFLCTFWLVFRNKHLHVFLVLNETVRNICDCLVVTSYICGVTILKQAILIRLNRFVNLIGQTIAEFVSTDSYSWFYIFISEVTVCFFAPDKFLLLTSVTLVACTAGAHSQ